MKEKRLNLIVDGEPPENRDIRPAPEMAAGRFRTEDGKALDRKPEHMTHLHGNVLVLKTHPRIVLGGRLDSLEAEVICLQTRARGAGEDTRADWLGEITTFCRGLMGSEVTEKPLDGWMLLGLKSQELREQSQQPRKYFGIGHLLPDCSLGKWSVELNRLRALSRQAELAAAGAFVRPGGTAERTDLLEGYVEPEFPSLLFAKDGEIYDLDGCRAVAIGGAYSVDKFYRLSGGAPWFPSEQPDERIKRRVEAQLEKAGWTMDCVLSHTTPIRYMPRHAFLPMAVGSSGRRVRKGRHLVMIIAAYTGAGKSTFAKRAEGAVDLATMPRRWFLSPSDGKDGAHEGEKSARYFLRDPRYPNNCILDVLRVEQEYPYVLIPTNARTIGRLWE